MLLSGPEGKKKSACEKFFFFAYFLGHSIFQEGSILELLWMLVKSESPVDRWCIISPYFVGLSTIILVVLIGFRNQFGRLG
jgi:hypothetical protein